MWDTLLGWWGWLRALWAAPGTVIFVGLDNAGKTSLQDRVCERSLSQHAPTQRATADDGRVRGTPWRVLDVGGHEEARADWDTHFVAVSAVVFVIDVHDAERLGEATQQLQRVVEAVPRVPVAVFLNKVDLAGPERAASCRAQMEGWLAGITAGRPAKLFAGSVTQNFGWIDAFAWLAQNLQ